MRDELQCICLYIFFKWSKLKWRKDIPDKIFLLYYAGNLCEKTAAFEIQSTAERYERETGRETCDATGTYGKIAGRTHLVSFNHKAAPALTTS